MNFLYCSSYSYHYSKFAIALLFAQPITKKKHRVVEKLHGEQEIKNLIARNLFFNSKSDIK